MRTDQATHPVDQYIGRYACISLTAIGPQYTCAPSSNKIRAHSLTNSAVIAVCAHVRNQLGGVFF